MVIVVFEGVGGEKCNYPGVRTITHFESYQHLDEWKAESGNRDIIVYQGTDADEASRIAGGMSLQARFGAFAAEVEQNPDALELHFANLRFALLRDIEKGYVPVF